MTVGVYDPDIRVKALIVSDRWISGEFDVDLSRGRSSRLACCRLRQMEAGQTNLLPPVVGSRSR